MASTHEIALYDDLHHIMLSCKLVGEAEQMFLVDHFLLQNLELDFVHQ